MRFFPDGITPMILSRSLAALAIVTVLSMPNRASAGFVSVSGVGNILEPSATPTGALPNFFNDTGANRVVHGWNERQNVTLDRDIFVDLAGSGLYNANADLGGFKQLKIARGTVVSSHLLNYDPLSRNQVTNVAFTFDAPILGVIVSSDRYHNVAHGYTDSFRSTDFLGNPATIYPAKHFDDRGLEWSEGDEVFVSGNTVTLSLWANGPGDQIRVITGSRANLTIVPAPPGVLLALAGLATLGLGRLVRRRGTSRAFGNS
jgi:hypothetical protein